MGNRRSGYYWVQPINKPFQLDEWVIAMWIGGVWVWGEKYFTDEDMNKIDEEQIVRNK